jgi:hypothetical protein
MSAMLTRTEARDILIECEVFIGDDFHALGAAKVMALFDAARRLRYRKPRKANGSTARYFHSYLQRRARNRQVLMGGRWYTV